jgi:hypothetical protein
MRLHTSSFPATQSSPHGCQTLSDLDDSIRDRSDIEIGVSGGGVDWLIVGNEGDLYPEVKTIDLIGLILFSNICRWGRLRSEIIGID